MIQFPGNNYPLIMGIVNLTPDSFYCKSRKDSSTILNRYEYKNHKNNKIYELLTSNDIINDQYNIVDLITDLSIFALNVIGFFFRIDENFFNFFLVDLSFLEWHHYQQ